MSTRPFLTPALGHPASQTADSQTASAHAPLTFPPGRHILDSVADGIFALDSNGFVSFLNPAAQALTGWNLAALTGHTFHSMLHHSHPDGSPLPPEQSPLSGTLHGGLVQHRDDQLFWRQDGTAFPVEYTSSPLLLEDGVIGAVIVFRDITDRLRHAQWEQDELHLLSSILAGNSLAATLAQLSEAFIRLRPGASIAIHRRIGDCLTLQAAAGLTAAGQKQLAEIPIAPAASLAGEAAFSGRTLSREPSAPGTLPEHALPLISPHTATAPPSRAGEPSPTSGPGPRTGELLGVVTVTDHLSRPTEAALLQQLGDLASLAIKHCKLQDDLLHQSQHDHLTGLPNRLLLEERLARAIRTATRRGNKVGVCYIDLDRFKQINDTLGHGIGDKYLQAVSARFVAHSREIDTLARQGGDEFILILPEIEIAEDAESVARRLLGTLAEPFLIEGERLRASASIGVAVFPDHGSSPTLLLGNADTALYAAKRAGRSRTLLYNQALGDQVRHHAKLTDDLETALAQQQFQLFYQPLYRPDLSLEGFEALLRWHHPDHGLLSPDRFIPIAEETALIVPLGEWVIRQACQQLQRWRDTGHAPTRLFVNVSGVQIGRSNFVDIVKQTLAEFSVDPRCLELEITETWIIADPEATSVQLNRLRALGVGVSMDDFGTGNSSLSTLHSLPLDTLKIDRSFISRMEDNDSHLATVRSIVSLARNLGLRTVAEGVERQSQMDLLRQMDCDVMQGFLMSRPMDVAEAEAVLFAAQAPPLAKAV